MKFKIGIIDLKLNNTFSVLNACLNKDMDTKFIDKTDDFNDIDALILPGVGSYHKAMYRLNSKKLTDPIINFISSGKPFLGICLGMQLLFEKSSEFVNTKGLSVLKGSVDSLISKKKNITIPHIGMSKISIKEKSVEKKNNKYLDDGKYYFNHSFIANVDDSSIITSTTSYEGVDFVSSIKSKNILATQFHPELSYDHGIKIFEFLKNQSWKKE